jgi:hypothetical protein
MTRNGDGETELIRGIVALKPRQLCIPEVFMLRETNPCWPMFTLLTHYDMFDLLDRMRPVSFFAQLPVLTHLSAYFNAFYFNIATRGDYTRKVREILTACRSLRVFVFFPLRVGDAMGSLPSIDDVRFVYIEFRHAMLEAGWLARTRGGTDHWARAEAFVEKKRRGEIQPGSFALIFLCQYQPLNSLFSFPLFHRTGRWHP